MKRQDKRASGDYQRAVGEFVGREVIYGVSALVFEIGREKTDDWFHLFTQDDWKSAVCEAIEGLPTEKLHEFLALNNRPAHPQADAKTSSANCLRLIESQNSWRFFCETNDIDPQQHEIYEHWIVSDWLASRLEERGELIERDFYGLTIWGRACTGQAILLDEVICSIYDAAHPEKSIAIAKLNDRFRRLFGLPVTQPELAVPGLIIRTRGVATLPPEIQVDIWNAVIWYDGFIADNDPHGEHDFGAFEIEGAGRIFWKIDYYADASCGFGSDDPSDITRCYRLMTIMLAEEYYEP